MGNILKASVSARLSMLFLGMLSLLIGMLTGLARLAVVVPDIATAQMGDHGALMIAAFLGTVISLERAVALARNWPFLAPLCAGLGGLSLLIGCPHSVAHAFFIMGGAILSAGSLLILRQQSAMYTATLALGALAWLIGSLTWWATGAIIFAVPWWMAFLVLTIAGERLELTRYLPISTAANAVFGAIVMLMLFGMCLAFWQENVGLALLGAGLLALSFWLLRFDIARRTVLQQGLTRFIAVCLLTGYGWLAFGGLLGLAGGFVAGSTFRDAALHAIFLGFVFSMIFGHAPIIFPAVAKVRIPYHPTFYLPWVALHVSLLARVVGDLNNMQALRQGAGIANALTLLLFVITMLVSLVRGRRK